MLPERSDPTSGDAIATDPATAERWQPLVVRAVVEETHDTKSIVFARPAGAAGAAFAYRPGQFLTLRLPIDGRLVPRCYSMASAPTLDEDLRVTVKRVAGGRGSNWICDQVAAGDTLSVLPPAGAFTPRTLDGDLLLFAGGSGITPVFSILRSALAAGNGRIVLFYANRDERSIIFLSELDKIAAREPQRLRVVHWLDSAQGVPSSAQLAKLAQPYLWAQAFICGPVPFMDACVAALEGVGMPTESIHVEHFASLPDDAQAAAAAETALAEPAAVAEAQLELRLYGEVHQLALPGKLTILDVALGAGLDAPFSCQAGMCSACVCRIVEGRVHMHVNHVLGERDLAQGLALACQAVPLTERIVAEFLG